MILEELMQILNSKKRNVSVVGAGGKTSLIFQIARELAAAGKKVLVTTTTHIFQPERNFARTYEEIMDLWNAGDYAVIGKESEGQKLTFSEKLYESVSYEADLILIEADGSKRLPCKIPADHEPVILADCDLIIGVMGMTAIGKPLQDICFRFETEGAWLTQGTSVDISGEDLLSPEIAAKILCDKRGSRKNAEGIEYIIVLNQCDDHELMSHAEKVKEEIKKISDIPVICTSLLMRE